MPAYIEPAWYRYLGTDLIAQVSGGASLAQVIADLATLTAQVAVLANSLASLTATVNALALTVAGNQAEQDAAFLSARLPTPDRSLADLVSLQYALRH